MKTTDEHVIQGTFNTTRHAERLRNANQVAHVLAKTKPVRPTVVKGRARKLWESLADKATWLTELDSTALAQYCVLTAEWEASPEHFQSGLYSAMRKLERDLLLTVPHRGKAAPAPPADESEHFDF